MTPSTYQDLTFFENIANEVTLVKGNALARENIYYLKEGTCVLTYLTHEGEESSFIYFYPDSLLNFLPSVLDANYISNQGAKKHFIKMNHTIYTKTDCKLLCVNGEKCLQYIEKKPEHYRFLLDGVLANFVNLLAISTDISAKTASGRVCQMLLDFMADDGSAHIPRYLTYAEISSYLSLHVITITKIFKALQDEGTIVKQDQQKIIKDKNRLLNIIKGKEKLVY